MIKLIGGGCLDGAALLLDQGAQDSEIVSITDVVKGVLDSCDIDMLLPEGLLYLAAPPLGIVDLVVDKGSGVTIIVNKTLALKAGDDTLGSVAIEPPAVELNEQIVAAVL